MKKWRPRMGRKRGWCLPADTCRGVGFPKGPSILSLCSFPLRPPRSSGGDGQHHMALKEQAHIYVMLLCCLFPLHQPQGVIVRNMTLLMFTSPKRTHENAWAQWEPPWKRIQALSTVIRVGFWFFLFHFNPHTSSACTTLSLLFHPCFTAIPRSHGDNLLKNTLMRFLKIDSNTPQVSRP